MKTRTLLLAPSLLMLGPSMALAQGDGPGPIETPYKALDSHRKEVTNFNVETVRGMVWNPLRSRLYAINTHGSRLLYHSDNDGVIDDQWTTVNNPVAIDMWVRGQSDYDLIVAGGSTHAVVRHDSTTGAILDMLVVPSEPGDLVVTPDNRAWVSCRGADVVVEIDLATFSILNEYPIPSERPRFLSWHADSDAPAGYRVFVAPMISGNNTINQLRNNDTSEVIALPVDDPATDVLEGLPDQDLFEMYPGTGVALPVVTRLGSMILEHAMHPLTNEMWVLAIDSKNADPNRQTEPSLQADFADNVVTLVTLPPQNADPVIAPQNIDLDDAIPGGPKNYSAATSCSFPMAVAIDPQTGYAFIASSTNDRLILLDPAGNRIWQRDLPVGSIPRDILLDRDSNLLTIYLWGTNELFVLSLLNVTGPNLTFDLGNDPTPATVAAGREHWYDADNSLHGRNTCNTCHPGGGSDFLGWSLTEPPLDRKDAMVTQSLLGIEDTFPYHWRGERQLRDFNRLAFPGLLGGTSLSDPEFLEFKDFVFSLQPPRNPRQDWKRVISDFVAEQGVFPTQGQDVFQNQVGLFGGFTCAECHTQPEGSNGGISFDNDTVAGITSNANLDVAHLRGLYNKNGGELDVAGYAEPLPRLGWGLSHNGDNGDVFDFLDPVPFGLTDKQRLDVAEFVDQWDQGIAPAAQLGWLLDDPTDTEELAAINTYLIPQASNAWLDVVVFGTIQDVNGQQVFARWLLNSGTGVFQANDDAIQLAGRPAGTALLTDFVTQASNNTAANTFMGVPPGNGRRLALDPDMDNLTDGEEFTVASGATNPELQDTDGDGETDGHEDMNGGNPTNPAITANDTTPPALLPGYPKFLDVSTSTAEYELRFTEPVTYTIFYNRPGEPTITRSRIHPVTEDTITLQDMKPSSRGATINPQVGPPIVILKTDSQYTLSITFKDMCGNSVSTPISHQPTLEPALEPILETPTTALQITRVIEGLNMTRVVSNGVLSSTVSVNVDTMQESLVAPGLNPRENQIVVAQVLKKHISGPFAGTWTVLDSSEVSSVDFYPNYTVSFTLANAPVTAPGALDNVLLAGPTDSVGDATVSFSVTGLVAGDIIRYNIVGIYEVYIPPLPLAPVENGFSLVSLPSWLLPLTDDDPQGNAQNSLRHDEVTF